MKDPFIRMRLKLSSFFIALSLRKEKVIVIDGTVTGSIRGANLVVVKENALCKADIEAKYLKVSGEVHDKVVCGLPGGKPPGQTKEPGNQLRERVFDFSSGYFATKSLTGTKV